ncbi:Serine carboxypeptidase ctsa-4.1 [Dirofilaria immitis]
MIRTHLWLLLFKFFAALSFVATLIQDDAEIDRIINLPGLTFVPNFTQYSGFLPTKTRNFLHYWLIESQNNPSTDPLVLWFNGASGCNSLDGLLAQIGPFRVDQDGETLFENIYSWNKVANIIFLDSPYGVGYSYRNTSVPSDFLWNDDQIADDNADALEQFFQRFKEYQNRDFYITGQGYAGIYGPTLIDVLLKRIQQNGNLYGIKLAGLAIGNGAYNEVDRRNSILSLSYYTGMLDKEIFENLTNCCSTAVPGPLIYCNFSQYINWTTNKPIDDSECATKVVQYAFNDQLINSFNNYQNCYMETVSSDDIISLNTTYYGKQPEEIKCATFIDQSSRINIESTDAQHGFPCWIRRAVRKYLNLPDVRKALHIPDNLPPWSMCSKTVLSNYTRQYLDIMPVFESIIHSLQIQLHDTLRILIYNGDADIQYNFLSNEWFVTRLTEGYQESEREQWTFQEDSQFQKQLAGYYQQFSMINFITIDFLTIKGAGHFAPLDRGGPTLQMFSNFIENIDYNINLRWDIKPKPILPQYRIAPKTILPRQLTNQIFNLPGLTYTINFNQYSGYLNASKGNYLHYWLVESQNDPSIDPLIIWFNGGPGCSSLIGLFTANGPFRPNLDGLTLFENVFSWNKLANVLHIESPRQVGFSYQDWAINSDDTFDDNLTMIDAYEAILDFFTIFPTLKKNDLYISGESYAGIYIPMLTAHMVQEIQKQNVELNLKGMIIGNGYLSGITNIRTLADYLYFHGFYGKKIWDQLQQCCPQQYDDKPTTECRFDDYIDITTGKSVMQKPGANQTCAALVTSITFERLLETTSNIYNLHQDCYRQMDSLFFMHSHHQQQHLLRRRSASLSKEFRNLQLQDAKIDNADKDPQTIYTYSTDALDGFPCNMYVGTTEYLNQAYVRNALHIPKDVPPFQLCSLNITYKSLYNDTTQFFQQLFDSNYPLRTLIYNGDLDAVCNFLQAQSFIEKFAKSNSMNMNEKNAWFYRLGRQLAPEIGGFKKRFMKNGTIIDLLTIKGAGHSVPLDRAGPMLQVLTNFIRQKDYNDISPFSMDRQPLLPQFNLACPTESTSQCEN